MLILCCIIVLDVKSVYLYYFLIIVFGTCLFFSFFMVFVYRVCVFCIKIYEQGLGYYLGHFLSIGDVPIMCILYYLFSSLIS